MKTDIIPDFQVAVTGIVTGVDKRMSQKKNTAYYIVDIDRDNQYSKHYQVAFIGREAKLAECLQVGQTVSIFCELQSKEWGSRSIINLRAIAFTNAHPAPQATDPQANVDTEQGNYQSEGISEEDLPF